jgi:2-oxoisovalerate dehydrogenase E1 component alpha subunit
MNRHADYFDADGPLTPTEIRHRPPSLPAARSLELHALMVRSRALEERTIQMSKSGESYFWVGGPGEEAFNVPLGLQVKKGQGPEYDYLHLHYRNAATMLAMGATMLDVVRQAAMTATDPFSMGRNFIGHFARPEWNVVPVTSVIEVQYTMAVGTALMQKRCEGDGVSIVTGGDAGTAEGDFTSCLQWATRPGNEVPVLIIVTNNHWGISTHERTQHGERRIADRGKPFGIPTEIVNGNDPVASWYAIERALAYCRKRRRPYLLEADVSRLYGHSSASGAERVRNEPDCVALFENKLLADGLLREEELARIHKEAREEADGAVRQAMREPKPTPADLWKHTYAPSPVDAVYPTDAFGLPA